MIFEFSIQQILDLPIRNFVNDFYALNVYSQSLDDENTCINHTEYKLLPTFAPQY